MKRSKRRRFSIGVAMDLAKKRCQLCFRLLSRPPDGAGETLALSPGVSALVYEDRWRRISPQGASALEEEVEDEEAGETTKEVTRLVSTV